MTYPTQHETFVAMIAEVQRKRALVDVRETAPPAEAEDQTRELVTNVA